MPRLPLCCPRVATCCLRTLCAPCLVLRFVLYKLSAAIPWRHRLFRHMLYLYAATFLLVLPLLCHDLVHSRFSLRTPVTKQQLKERLLALNSRRIEDAEEHLRTLNRTRVHQHQQQQQMFSRVVNKNDAPIDLAISVVTVSRNRRREDNQKPKYLTQVVVKLLQQMQEAKDAGFLFSMHLEICNVDFDPNSYHEAKSLSAYVPMVQRFNKTHLTLDGQLEKEKKDYVFCLSKAQRLKPRYTLLIEDDALPVDAFFPVLQHTISSHLDQQHLRGELRERTEHVAFVKLYHPERLLSYFSLEVERIPQWISLSAILSTLTTICYHRTLNRSSSVSPCVLQLVFLVYFLLVCLMVDNSNINEFRRLFPPYLYSYVPAPECCTPAILFPREGAETLISYLESVKCKLHFGKDIAMKQFIAKSHDPKWNAYMVQPNLITHIGMHSALRQALVDPFLV